MREGQSTGSSRGAAAAAAEASGATSRPQSASSAAAGVSQAPVRVQTAEDPRRYLLRFGYAPGEAKRPRLSITLESHEEEGGHTLYFLGCTLSYHAGPEGGFSSTAWSCRHRLCDLRQFLHDEIKAALGPESYEAHFGETPFARHGGPPGTTQRLSAWLGSLSACFNSDCLEAPQAAQVLRFLGAPIPEGSDALLKQHDEQALRAQGRCRKCTVSLQDEEEADGFCGRCQAKQTAKAQQDA